MKLEKWFMKKVDATAVEEVGAASATWAEPSLESCLPPPLLHLPMPFLFFPRRRRTPRHCPRIIRRLARTVPAIANRSAKIRLDLQPNGSFLSFA